jgi:hypothetical protein
MSSVEDPLTTALTITAGALREETLRPLALPERTRRRWPLVLAPVAAATAVALVVGIEVGVARITSAHQPASGAGHAAATVSIGKSPANIAFDAADKTIYVLNNWSQTLTMVGTAACNASTTRGCGQIRQTSAGAAYPQDVAVDEHTRTVYVLTGFQSSTVAVIDATTCNAATTSGCLTGRWSTSRGMPSSSPSIPAPTPSMCSTTAWRRCRLSTARRATPPTPPGAAQRLPQPRPRRWRIPPLPPSTRPPTPSTTRSGIMRWLSSTGGPAVPGMSAAAGTRWRSLHSPATRQG